MGFLQVFLLSAGVSFVYVFLVWIESLVRKDAKVSDTTWGLGFVIVAVCSLYLGSNFLPKQILVTTLIFLWGLRHSFHVYLRSRWRGEDWRYDKLRKDLGDDFNMKSFVRIFMLRGLFMIVISTPVIFINSSPEGLVSGLCLIGAAIWTVGFFLEAVADHQLIIFKLNPVNKNKIMKSGLWRFSRHPNYFGEVMMWWGIFIIALSDLKGLFTIVGPLAVMFLVLRMSGISLLEEKYRDNKEFQEYKKATSTFFPWFPK